VGEWLPLTSEANAEPTDTQQAFLAEARALLKRLNPVRACNSWAALLGEGLILVMPLDRAEGWPLAKRGSLHTSVQLMMRGSADRPRIVGAWHDGHYAWDHEPKHVGFEVDDDGLTARSQALDWLATQLRRPISREDWVIFGVTLCSRWREADSGTEFRGLIPLGLLLRDRPTRSVPAGFFDPW
jgi:hypothetical protein